MFYTHRGGCSDFRHQTQKKSKSTWEWQLVEKLDAGFFQQIFFSIKNGGFEKFFQLD